MHARRVLLPLALLALFGCNEPASSTTTKIKPNRAAADADAEPDAAGPAVPVIASAEATYEFGTISPSETVTHVFKLQNRGTADLHIEKVERT